jgi:hypothetical protein
MFDATMSRRNAMLALGCIAKACLPNRNATPLSQRHPGQARLAAQESNPVTTLQYGRVLKNLPLDTMRDALKDFSPLVWLDRSEEYRPSSVDFAFENMERFESKIYEYPPPPLTPKHAYCLKAKESFNRTYYPSFFNGEKYGTDNYGNSICTATCYAFFVDKIGPFTDLSYFFFYPFNFVVFGNGLFGNHVGDWEYVTVRICWTHTPEGWANPQPWSVYASSHDGAGVVRQWASVTHSDLHPIIYSAAGSHANYYENGTHVHDYVIPDFCSQGTPWYTWKHLASFHWNPANPDPETQGTFTMTKLNGPEVPTWMTSNQYDDRGSGVPTDPKSGPIYRWGNEPDWILKGTGDSPEGPLQKWEVWRPSKLG